MKAKQSHTPGPWYIHHNKVDIISSQDRFLIAHVSTEYRGNEYEANAEFIVRACNDHDELLTQLKLAKSMLVAKSNIRIGDLDEIEQAIAKAEGGSK